MRPVRKSRTILECSCCRKLISIKKSTLLVVERKEQIEIKEQEVKWKEGELNATTVRLPAEAEIHRRRKEDSGGKECSDREREDQDNMHGRSLGVRQHRQCRHGETEAGSRRLRAVRGRCHYDPTSGGSSKDCHRSGRFPCQDR
ncbi:uncharacterized protein LOC108915657 [Anoplophora glabripennis]|uniref:uncharacterized protein LOC108915657 n=1 Tax=Anoplophora glabripennis TaxID=217634 RepID=UPI0008746FC0|nr:uncharacterized protein LOC108915657 [Anoplophora glabripennis]